MTAKALIQLLIDDQRNAPHARHLVDDLGSTLRRMARETVWHDRQQALEALADQCDGAVREMPDD